MHNHDVILSAVIGSRAYGTDHEDSDTDILGVFLAPTIEIAGLDWNAARNTWTDSSPEGDDHTYHELGKFLGLCLKNNPNLLELLFAESFQILGTYGLGIINLREHFLSESLRETYLGFIDSNLKYLRKRDEDLGKKAMHSLRLARNGVELLTTGHLTVRVADPGEYIELTQMSKDDMMTKLEREIQFLADSPTILPEKPNAEPVKKFLLSVREASAVSGYLKRQHDEKHHRLPR
jgi:uncharacterized protein